MEKNVIKKYVKVLKELIKIRFQNIMMFRIGFFGPFFVDGSLFLVQLMVFKAVYANVDSIGSWGSGEMLLYIGSFSLLNAVSMVICFFGIIDIPRKIKTGEMDLYLTKPVSPLFRITFEKINPGSIPLVIMSFIIIGYAISKMHMMLTVKSVLSYIFWMILMIFFYYIMETLIRALSFFFISNSGFEQMENVGIDLCMKLPGVAFYGIYKVIFYCVLPYGIMATLPVQSLVGEMDLRMAILGIGIVMVFSTLFIIVWRMGIRNYNSASS